MPHRFSLYICCLLVFVASVACGEENVVLPAKKDFHLFLLVGQSNMAGRGQVAAQDQIVHPRVLTLTKDQQWKHAVDPIHFDKSVAGVGLGRTFGIVVAEAMPEVTIGLIPCAVGGSPIAAWQPGGYHTQTKSHPYDECLQRAKVALQAGTLKGILWHQGESDSNEGRAEVYEEKLHELVQRFRRDLDAPNVPFIVGQLGQFEERPWSDQRKRVDQAHRSLPTKVDHTAFVSSEGLGHKGDEVHFSAEACRELGRRYAEAYLGQ